MLTKYRMNRAALAKKALLLADDPNGERFSSEQVNEALNDAMLELALDVRLILEKLTILLREQQHLYEIHPRVKVAGLRPYGYPVRSVYDVTTNAALTPYTSELHDSFGMSLGETGGPTTWRTDLFPHGEIALFPLPASDGDTLPALTGNIELTYTAMPTLMDDDADYPDTLPAQYHEAVAVGAAMLLLEGGATEEDFALSVAMEAEFENWKAMIVR
ncbi:MAG TPA: hypothetical protein PKV86_16065, partial [Syntrophobacteraceae bacterium]|nr:hypothetical protein [Syntrophobacteraceae bacterium]